METEGVVSEATLDGEDYNNEQVVAEEEMDTEELVKDEAGVANDTDWEDMDATDVEEPSSASGTGESE